MSLECLCNHYKSEPCDWSHLKTVSCKWRNLCAKSHHLSFDVTLRDITVELLRILDSNWNVLRPESTNTQNSVSFFCEVEMITEPRRSWTLSFFHWTLSSDNAHDIYTQTFSFCPWTLSSENFTMFMHVYKSIINTVILQCSWIKWKCSRSPDRTKQHSPRS